VQENNFNTNKNMNKVLVGSFQYYHAPVTTSISDTVWSIKDAYVYISSDVGAMKHTLDLGHIIKEVKDGINPDKSAARKYKAQNFDFACFSGTFSYRKDEAIVQHSGLICLDFDHVGDSRELWKLKGQLIADPYFTTWLAFVSPSGDGLKWVISIDISRADHRTWFRALQNYIRMTYQLEVAPSGINVSRACFLPFDANCYVHPDILKDKDVCPF
jgi:hypothetical protein